MDNELAVWRPARNSITCSDANKFLWQLESESVHCVVTSPPYYGLRDYGVDGQIGLEETPQAYLARMVAVFAEVRRVLRSDGVAFCNMGDSYASVWGSGGRRNLVGNPGRTGRSDTVTRTMFKEKDLMLMPHRLAIALQDDGWFVRSDIVWKKPNPMPESVTDRPTNAHEYVFMLTKSARYWADMDAVREATDPNAKPGKAFRNGRVYVNNVAFNNSTTERGEDTSGNGPTTAGRNLRSVWTIATQPTSEAHFATYPQELVSRCVKMGAPAKTCAECGAGWVRVVEVSGGTIGKSWHDHDNDLNAGQSQIGFGLGAAKSNEGNTYQRITKGFRPSCECASDETQPGLVLDPFMGSGTTGLVARRLGRDYIGCDLSAEYVAMAQARLQTSDPFQATPLADGSQQLSLFEGEVA